MKNSQLTDDNSTTYWKNFNHICSAWRRMGEGGDDESVLVKTGEMVNKGSLMYLIFVSPSLPSFEYTADDK